MPHPSTTLAPSPTTYPGDWVYVLDDSVSDPPWPPGDQTMIRNPAADGAGTITIKATGLDGGELVVPDNDDEIVLSYHEREIVHAVGWAEIDGEPIRVLIEAA